MSVPRDRIALVVTGDVANAGGVESSTQRIARGLARHGRFAVDLVMLRPDLGRHYDEDFYSPTPISDTDGVRTYELPALSTTAFPAERAFHAHLGLVDLLRRERHLLVHGLYASTAGFHATYAAREAGIPAVVGLRGNDIHADVFHAARFAHLRWTLERADLVTAVSSEALRRADLLTGCGARGRVILNSIDPTAYRDGTLTHTDGSPVIGSLAKFRGKKAAQTLIAAFARLAATHPRARLVLIGGLGGDAQSDVLDAITVSGLGARVVLTGPVERADAAAHIRGLDVFVHAALHDGSPNAVLEAMLAGTPVVATAVGAIPEMLTHGREAVLVSPAGSPTALYEGIVAALDADRRALTGRATEALATRFTPHREIQELVDVYEACAGTVMPCVSASSSPPPTSMSATPSPRGISPNGSAKAATPWSGEDRTSA
ncbi:MAG: glycosyltransferase [Catenulispora sp.]|nr:glycosyltransferase [Catenulispora sp.]